MNYTSESYKVSDWKYYNSSKLKAMNSYYDEMGVFPTIDDFELSGNAYYIVYKYNNTSCIDEYIIYDEDGNKIGDFGAVAPLSEYGITFKNTNEPVMDSDYFKIKWTDSDTYVQIEFHEDYLLVLDYNYNISAYTKSKYTIENGSLKQEIIANYTNDEVVNWR